MEEECQCQERGRGLSRERTAEAHAKARLIRSSTSTTCLLVSIDGEPMRHLKYPSYVIQVITETHLMVASMAAFQGKRRDFVHTDRIDPYEQGDGI